MIDVLLFFHDVSVFVRKKTSDCNIEFFLIIRKVETGLIGGFAYERICLHPNEQQNVPMKGT